MGIAMVEPVIFTTALEQQRSINILAFMPRGCQATANALKRSRSNQSPSGLSQCSWLYLGKGISTDEPHRATLSRESDGYISAYPY